MYQIPRIKRDISFEPIRGANVSSHKNYFCTPLDRCYAVKRDRIVLDNTHHPLDSSISLAISVEQPPLFCKNSREISENLSEFDSRSLFFFQLLFYTGKIFLFKIKKRARTYIRYVDKFRFLTG